MPQVVKADDPLISKGGFVCSRQVSADSFALYFEGEIAPPVPVAAFVATLPAADFLSRFTDVELKLWNSESGTDAAVYLLKLQAMPDVDPAGDFVADMLRVLQAAGIVDKGRAAELTAAP